MPYSTLILRSTFHKTKWRVRTATVYISGGTQLWLGHIATRPLKIVPPYTVSSAT